MDFLPLEQINITKAKTVLSFPGLEIRINEQAVYHNNHPVPLTNHEFFILLYLAAHPSWVLSKEQIYEAVWKENPEHCGAAVAKCGVFAQTEDRRWVYRNGDWERLSVCGRGRVKAGNKEL